MDLFYYLCFMFVFFYSFVSVPCSLDDILNINNVYFGNMVSQIYTLHSSNLRFARR